MKRGAHVALTSLLATLVLSGCGGGGAYCDAVETNQKVLDAFGSQQTDAAYAKDVTALEAVGKVAPQDVKASWTQLADATKEVVAVHESIGLKIEDRRNRTKVDALTSEQRQQINKVTEAFNATTKQRAAVVKDVKQECKITLK